MTILAQIGAMIVEWLFTKAFAVLQLDCAQWTADKAKAQAAKDAETNLENAKTGDEIDKATDSSLNNL